MLPNHVPDDETLQNYVKAGRIAAQALHYGEHRIKEGALIREVLDDIEAFIAKKGAAPAFPAQISLNDVAAHFCPAADDDITFKNDLVKLDVGVHVDGYIGDNALTISLDKGNEQHSQLIAASRAARDAAIKILKAGVTPHELGVAIEREITSRGFQPIRNLSGHGLGHFQIHTPPSIPNYPSGERSKLLANHVIAIEPFATTGKGMIKSGGNATLYAIVTPKPVRTPVARDALEIIKRYNGLPFASRWIANELGVPKARLALVQLKQAGVIHEYAPLPEVGGGLVSQSEHTVLILDEKARILTLDDD